MKEPAVANERAAWAEWLSSSEAETARWNDAAAASWELARCEIELGNWSRRRLEFGKDMSALSPSQFDAQCRQLFDVRCRQIDERASAMDAVSAAEAALDTASAAAKTLGEKWARSSVELKRHNYAKTV